MDIDFLVKLAEFFQAFITGIAILIGGVWAYRKFIIYKEDFPRINFHVDVLFLGVQDGYWLVEVLGYLKNEGQVPHEINSLKYELRYLEASDNIVDGDESINKQVYIPHILKEGSWLPYKLPKAMVILPQVELRYNHIAKIPGSVSFVLIHGWLDYGKKGMLHRADKLIRVPQLPE